MGGLGLKYYLLPIFSVLSYCSQLARALIPAYPHKLKLIIMLTIFPLSVPYLRNTSQLSKKTTNYSAYHKLVSILESLQIICTIIVLYYQSNLIIIKILVSCLFSVHKSQRIINYDRPTFIRGIYFNKSHLLYTVQYST